MTLSATDFELLLQANRILSSKLDIDEVLQAVMELATKVVKAEASSILLLDEVRNELYFDVALGDAKESVKRVRLKVGEGIAGWVAKEKKPIIVNDVSKDGRFSKKADKTSSFVTKSILAVPLMSKGQLIGVVEAINKEMNGEFSDTDKMAFGIFASQSGIAIENARLFSEALREKNKLKTVFAEMSDGVILLTKDGKIELMNKSAETLLGLKTDAVAGKVFDSDVLSDFHVNPSLGEVKDMKLKTQIFDLEREKGVDYFLSLLVVRLEASEKNNNDGFLIIVRNITDARKGERLKSNFLSLISHKLKTPLTVIIGYAPLLKSSAENFNDFQKKAVDSICQQGDQLNGLVDKLLHYTIVESEKLDRTIDLKAIDFLLDAAIKSMASMIDETKTKIHVDASVQNAPTVLVDGPLMIDVFKNILENGMKFNNNPEKHIKVSAEKFGDDVKVHFVDNGIGIPSEERENVFQKFYQIENAFTGQVPGAGLGLALCKKVVTLMGGQIQLDSEIGSGTTVTLTLPSKRKVHYVAV